MAEQTGKKNKLKQEETFSSTAPKKKSGKGNKRPKAKKNHKENRVGTILGIFLILFALYSAISFTSYLFHFFGFGNDDALLQIKFSELFTNDIQHNNWAGRVGAILAYQFVHQWFGIASYIISFYIFILGVFLATKHQLLDLWKSFRYSVALLVWLSLSTGFIFYYVDRYEILGGVFGYRGAELLISITGKIGTGFLLLFFLLSITTFAFNIPLKWIDLEKSRKRREEKRKEKEKRKALEKEAEEIRKQQRASEKPGEQPTNKAKFNTEEYAVKDDSDATEPLSVEKSKSPDPENDPAADKKAEGDSKTTAGQNDEIEFTIEPPSPAEEVSDEKHGNERMGLDTEYDPTLDLPHFKFPPKDLLSDYNSTADIQVEKKELEENKQQIVDTLQNYSIKIISIKATPGPSITLYEIVPAPGIRISKIKNLEDDIAMSLAAHGIRIIAPIPGRGTIGIEVPNNKPQIVAMKSILTSKKFVQSNYDLPIGLGKTISNESYIADLAKMPHLLMAGATGQGKSVGLNAIISSLIYKKHPATLKFVLVDPKKVELTLYNKIERHYLAKLPDNEEAIVTDTREVVRTLNSMVIEMEDRYNLLKDAQVKGISEYNRKFIARRLNPENGHRFMPYIVLIIDEFADLIMTSGKEIEGPITRLAQLARAIGIHLIIATQRPSVNIITGSIKANFPARIAYRVISKVDSRTILDTGGADQLVGRGDMLLSTGKELVRLQGAFIDTDEIENLTEYIGSQRAYPEAYKLPEYYDEESETSKDLEDLGRDELFEEAARLVVSNQHGSTSLLQRKMKIGYNRAGRIIDQLEAAGVVGPFEGSKAREVLLKDNIALEQLLDSMNNKEDESGSV